MQSAANSSVLLPTFMEQIFDRLASSGPESQERKDSLVDLYELLGRRLVPSALRILDRETITVYTNNPKTAEVVESGHIRLFLHINYCTCEYFQDKVLIKKDSGTAPYTCQHILAARLAIIFQHKCLQIKEIPSHNLDIILTSLTQ